MLLTSPSQPSRSGRVCALCMLPREYPPEPHRVGGREADDDGGGRRRGFTGTKQPFLLLLRPLLHSITTMQRISEAHMPGGPSLARPVAPHRPSGRTTPQVDLGSMVGGAADLSDKFRVSGLGRCASRDGHPVSLSTSTHATLPPLLPELRHEASLGGAGGEAVRGQHPCVLPGVGGDRQGVSGVAALRG
jgi:hypothetical protein